MARLVAKLREDILVLGIHHRHRDLEIVPLGKLIEQLALHVRAGELVELLALLVADQALELVEALETERLRELLVDLSLAAGLHALTVTEKIAGFLRDRRPDSRPGTLLRGRDCRPPSRRRAAPRTRDQAARAELDLHVLALAAVEDLAVDLPHSP